MTERPTSRETRHRTPGEHNDQRKTELPIRISHINTTTTLTATGQAAGEFVKRIHYNMLCLSLMLTSIGFFVTANQTGLIPFHAVPFCALCLSVTCFSVPISMKIYTRQRADAREKFTVGAVNKKSNKNFARIVRTYFNTRYQNIYIVSPSPSSVADRPSLMRCMAHTLPLPIGIAHLNQSTVLFMGCNSHYYFYYHRQFYKSKRNTQFAYNLHNANTRVPRSHNMLYVIASLRIVM